MHALGRQNERMRRIAILYPGGLGSALGRAFVGVGHGVLTFVADRSEATRSRALAAGFQVAASLTEIARESDVIVSLVPPGAAIETARSLGACLADNGVSTRMARRPVFVEGNSVAPRTKLRIARILSQCGVRCVDGAFFGPANRVGRENLLGLSGPDYLEVADLFQEVIEVRAIGSTVGDAAALKMASTMLTKGLPALFLEIAGAAAKQGQLEAILSVLRKFYPGIVNFLERTLPTYPAYVSRRKCELQEAVSWLDDIGQCANMTRSAVTVFDSLQHTRLPGRNDWSFEDLLSDLGSSGFLCASRPG